MVKAIIFDNGKQQAVSIDTLREVIRHLLGGCDVEIRTVSSSFSQAVAAISGAKIEGFKC